MARFVQQGIVKHGHFRLRSGRCSDTYFNKSALFRQVRLAKDVLSLAARLVDQTIPPDERLNGIIGPATEGALFAFGISEQLIEYGGYQLGFWSAKYRQGQLDISGDLGSELSGKRILLCDDVLTAGTTVRELITLVRHYGGEVAGAIVICNRGDETASSLGVPYLLALTRLEAPTHAAPCPACLSGEPFDEGVGHPPDTAFATGAGP